jgi:hypothetical protein
MNQQQVKDKLLQLENVKEDFTVIFSGKRSSKVNGLYYPDRKEIILHNKNFIDDNQLMYTAIHEYAHHVQFMKAIAPVSTRVHTIQFWNIFHRLLFRAEELGIYNNVFDTIPAFRELTAKIKNEYLVKNGYLMKEFGALLMKARELCSEHSVSFEDYVDRILGIHRNEAKIMIKTHVLGINPQMGYENMKMVARISDEGLRREVEQAYFEENTSLDMLRAGMKPEKEFETRLRFLETEKERIEQALERLTARLVKVERDIDEIKRSV